MKGKINRIRINDAIHMPKVYANSLSVNKILSSNLKVQFNVNECIVGGSDGETNAIALCQGNLYQRTFTKRMWPIGTIANLWYV